MCATKSPPLERYFAILEAVAADPTGLTVSEMAARCGLAVGTAHRALQILLRAGLVAPAAPGRKEYVLGQRLVRLVHAGSGLAWVRIAAQPILDRLANQIDETCFITKLIDTQIVSVAWAVPKQGLRGYVVPGHVMPPHASASAKSILAFQPEELVDKILKGPLPRLSPATKTDTKTIKAELAEVRARNYAICWQEIETGLVAYACPIPIPVAGVLYAIGTSGLLDRFVRRSEKKLLAALRTAADELSRSLQHGPPAMTPDALGLLAAE